MRFVQRLLAAAAFLAWHCASVVWRVRAWRWTR